MRSSGRASRTRPARRRCPSPRAAGHRRSTLPRTVSATLPAPLHAQRRGACRRKPAGPRGRVQEQRACGSSTARRSAAAKGLRHQRGCERRRDKRVEPDDAQRHALAARVEARRAVDLDHRAGEGDAAGARRHARRALRRTRRAAARNSKSGSPLTCRTAALNSLSADWLIRWTENASATPSTTASSATTWRHGWWRACGHEISRSSSAVVPAAERPRSREESVGASACSTRSARAAAAAECVTSTQAAPCSRTWADEQVQHALGGCRRRGCRSARRRGAAAGGAPARARSRRAAAGRPTASAAGARPGRRGRRRRAPRRRARHRAGRSSSSGSATLCATLRCGSTWKAWNTKPRRAPAQQRLPGFGQRAASARRRSRRGRHPACRGRRCSSAASTCRRRIRRRSRRTRRARPQVDAAEHRRVAVALREAVQAQQARGQAGHQVRGMTSAPRATARPRRRRHRRRRAGATACCAAR